MSGLGWPDAFVFGCILGVFAYFLYLVARRAPTLSQIERLRMEPGDVLVVTITTPGPFRAKDAELLKLSIEKYLGCKAMVIQKGMKLSVLSPTEKQVGVVNNVYAAPMSEEQQRLMAEGIAAGGPIPQGRRNQ